MSHPRTTGREIALQYLYMHDVLLGKDVLDFDAYISTQHTTADRDSIRFGHQLITDVLAHRAELDAEISSVATNWNIERMSAVDRNVLRLGLAELVAQPQTPYKVILNEAIELAKHFSSDDAGSFVNGILDKLRLKLRPEGAAIEGAG